MADPTTRFEGNLRLASLAVEGYPTNADELYAEVLSHLRSQQVTPYGPLVVFFALPPSDEPPSQWSCQVGTALTGQPFTSPVLLLEDYRHLHALCLPHAGSIRELVQTYHRLADHGRAMGHRVRPYWRLSLRRRRMADGSVLPQAEAAVFLDS